MNSKLTLAAMMLFIASPCGLGQTNAYNVITNWVKPGPNVRVYNGQTYYVDHSRLWKTFAQWEGLGTGMIEGGPKLTRTFGLIAAKRGSLIEVNIVKQTHYGNAYGETEDGGKELLRRVMIANYPKEAVTGDGVSGYCIRSTNFVAPNGTILPVYDFGVQQTNLVPERVTIPNKSTK